jgi:hypothetical protein
VSVLFVPGSTNGVIIDSHRTTHFERFLEPGSRATMSKEWHHVYRYTPVFLFSVNNRSYIFKGTNESDFVVGDTVSVLYNRLYPAFAVQNIFLGFIDFTVIKFIWIFFLVSGYFYVLSNRNFFEFRMQKLNLKWFLGSMAFVLVFPLFFHVNDLWHTRLIKGYCTSHLPAGTKYTIETLDYTYNGVTHVASPYPGTLPDLPAVGESCYVIIDTRNPERGNIFYVLNYLQQWQLVIIALMFILGGSWYLATWTSFRREYPDKMV